MTHAVMTVSIEFAVDDAHECDKRPHRHAYRHNTQTQRTETESKFDGHVRNSFMLTQARCSYWVKLVIDADHKRMTVLSYKLPGARYNMSAISWPHILCTYKLSSYVG